MSTCLSDEELVLAYYGDASPAPGHLQTCLRCAGRYRLLASDLDTIRGILSQSQGEAGTRVRASGRWRAVAIAAAFAGLALVGVIEAWMWRGLPSITVTTEQVDPETVAFLDRVAGILSTFDDSAGGSLLPVAEASGNGEGQVGVTGEDLE